MSKIQPKRPKIVYSRYTPGCTAEFLGEPDAKGVQAARITDPTVNDGEPFNGLTMPSEWSSVPTVATPDILPAWVDVVVWEDEDGGVHMDAVAEALPTDWDDATTIGYFRCKIPSILIPVHGQD